jgi:APA family basic amino acid/polyamine antiporter
MSTPEPKSQLIRGVGLWNGIALNMNAMIGVGPFITMPLIISAMGGPQAMIGWIIAALLVMCDGLVWAELGAMMPKAGGPYRYLQEMYGPKWGRLTSFLYKWQLTFSAPLSMASGCVGLAGYASYLWPSLLRKFYVHSFKLGSFGIDVNITWGTFFAMATVAFAVTLLYRRITLIGKMSSFLWVGVFLTIIWVIFAGVTHFDPAKAFDFPPNAFDLNSGFFLGLGAAMLVAVYDYWGYYNVCYIGGEMKDPGRTIPRAVLISIAIVAVLYIVMNISILGVIHWKDFLETAKPENSDARKYIISTFMQQLYGGKAASLATVLMIWVAFASVFSLLLGYSRIPYAAAVDGHYFKAFARVHPIHRFPTVSLLAMGAITMFFCLFSLSALVTALVVIRISVQFIAQILGVIVLRIREPNRERPFKMWLFPVPAILALIGFVYVLIERPKSGASIISAIVVIVVGVIIFLIRASQLKQWPFGDVAPQISEDAS